MVLYFFVISKKSRIFAKYLFIMFCLFFFKTIINFYKTIKKMKKLFVLLMLSFTFIFASYSQKYEKIGEKERIEIGYKHDLSNLLKGIIYVESQGNCNAISKSGKCVGILQITPILVKDCNRIIGKKKYTLHDRLNKSKSIEMFYIIQKHYNKEGDIRKGAYIWRGGNVNENKDYYQKVKENMN